MELDQYKQTISNYLIDLDQLINRSPLFSNDHKKWKGKIVKLMSEIRNQIRWLQDGINDLEDIQRPSYVNSVRSYVTKLKKLEGDITKRERGDSFTGTTSSNQGSPSPILQTEEQKRINAQQAYLFNKGDEAIETTMGAVNDMKGMTERGQ